MKLAELAESIGARLSGQADPAEDITGIANLRTAAPGQLSFLNDPRYREALGACRASAVIVREADAPHVAGAALIMDDPYVGFARAAQLLDTTPPVAREGIDPRACIEPGVTLGEGVAIGPFVHVRSGAVLGDGVQIGAGCCVGCASTIGSHTRLHPQVSIYHEVEIGSHCMFQAGAVIGSDGFGYANDRGTWLKIPQRGRVRVGSFTEIGAGTCIDRGALDDTEIGDNVIIDNLCQIAHNVRIGTGTAIAGGTVFAGSVTVGAHCIIGGTSIFNGHIRICDGTTILGNTVVMRDIEIKGTYASSVPCLPYAEWRRMATRVMHINDMYRRLTALEQEVRRSRPAAP